MAATDIPPTPLVLRIPGLKGDQALSGFNVQSYDWSLENNGSGPNNVVVALRRLTDTASPQISLAFALRKNVANDVTLTMIDAAGAEVVSYVLTDPRVRNYELAAAVGGSERATETVVLAASHITITIAKSKRSWTL